MIKISDVSASNPELLNKRENCPNSEDKEGHRERVLVVVEPS